jgi:hypothetical protein
MAALATRLHQVAKDLIQEKEEMATKLGDMELLLGMTEVGGFFVGDGNRCSLLLDRMR